MKAKKRKSPGRRRMRGSEPVLAALMDRSDEIFALTMTEHPHRGYTIALRINGKKIDAWRLPPQRPEPPSIMDLGDDCRLPY